MVKLPTLSRWIKMNNGRCATCLITRYDDECEDYDKEFCDEYAKTLDKLSRSEN